MPFGVSWNVDHGKYMVFGMSCLESSFAAHAHNARLDTFTRCHETTAMMGVIVDDLIRKLERLSMHVDTYDQASIFCTVQNAKQIMEQKK